MHPEGIANVMAGMSLPGNAPQTSLQRTYKGATKYELDYETAGLHMSVYEAFRATQWFLNDIQHKQTHLRRWLSLLGASGCGKTHLARKVVEVLKAEGRGERFVQFWSWRGAMQHVLADGAVMRWLIDRPVLVLDDIGTGFTESTKARALNASLLYELLEGRLGKWTFLTSNLAPAHIEEQLDARIASRLYRGFNEIVNMSEAGDYCYDRHPAKEGETP